MGTRTLATSLALLGALALPLAGCGSSDGDRAERLAPPRVTTLGINSYLWRAALDTIDFMPLQQVDSDGGVILTDWYANPGNPNERVKLTVMILDPELRADAVRVSAVRQQATNGAWTDSEVQPGTTQRLEEIILMRARDLRQRAAG